MPSKRGAGRNLRAAYRVAILASLFLHSFLFPVPWRTAFLWLFAGKGIELRDLDGEAVLPIELELLDETGAGKDAAGGGGIPKLSPSASASASSRPVGSGSASVAPSAPPPPKSARPKPPPAPSASTPPVSSAPPSVRDPVDMSGKAGAVAAHNPNVSLMLALDLIRNHPAGKDLGPALATLPLWELFFTGTDVDPVRDLDKLLIAGPSLRKLDGLVAVVKMKDGDSRLHHVIDEVRGHARPEGEWVSDEPPVAKVRVGKQDDFFVQAGDGVAMIVPEKLLDEAKKNVGATFPKNKSEAVVLFMRSPGKALRGAPIAIPETLAWVRFAASVRPDGAANVVVDMKDADAETAQKDATFLTNAVDALNTQTLPIVGTVHVLDPITFVAKGDHVTATTVLTSGQLREMAKLVAQTLSQVGKNP